MATILWAHTVPLYSIQLSALLALRQDRPLSVSNFLEMSQKMTKKVQPHTSIDKSRMNQMINHREIENKTKHSDSSWKKVGYKGEDSLTNDSIQ